MKKILLSFVTIAAIFLLVACNKNKTFAKVELKNVQVFEDSITFEVDLTDPNEEIGDDVNINITIYEKGKTTSLDETKVEKQELADHNKFSFKRLKAENEYTIKVTSTINSNLKLLYEGNHRTSLEAGKNEIDITTIEDFLKIKDNPGATYHLKNDLDFTGAEDQINGKPKEGESPAITAGYITTFDGIFNGNGYTISNYVLNKGSSHFGLFGTLSNDAVVKDLKIDNMTMDIQTTGSTRQAGILFGRALNNKIIIDNIEITNSSLTIKLDSVSSNNHNIGLLGGRSTAQISNIYIDENTNLTVNAERIGEPRIGGLVGQINDKNASVKNVEVNGTIDVNVEQDEEKGLSGSKVNLLIGGVVGHAWQLTTENIISRTTININKLDFNINEEKSSTDKIETKNLTVSLRVGGLFGALGNTKLINAIYEGNINVAQLTIVDENFNEEKPDAKLPYKYTQFIFVGAIASEAELDDPDYLNVLRINGKITIANQEDVSVRVDNLFGQIKNSFFEYKATNKFGILGEIIDENINDKIKTFNNLKDLFDENSWIYKTYNN